MKGKCLNRSSMRTRKLIKEAFLELLAEKKEVSRIGVSELAARAGISRATFYAHFDDIYGMVDAFEDEMIDRFFTDATLLATDDYEKFFDAIFSFLEENDENYKMICKSNEMLFSASRLNRLAIGKFMDLVDRDPKIVNRELIELDIGVFFQGILIEYIKYCRGLSAVTPHDLRAYAEDWYRRFLRERRVA